MNDTRDLVPIYGSLGCRSQMELRLLYSIAVIRAVNGLVDARQQSYYAESVLSLATSMGIASWIVELRHDATHNELPSLSTLRDACNHLLNWLQSKYWSQQSDYLSRIESHPVAKEDFEDEEIGDLEVVSAAGPSMSALGIRAIITNFLRDSHEEDHPEFETFYSDNTLNCSTNVTPNVGISLLVSVQTFVSGATLNGRADDTDLWTCVLCIASIILIENAKELSSLMKDSKMSGALFSELKKITKFQILLWPKFVLVSFLCHLCKFLNEKDTSVSSPFLRENLLRAIWDNLKAITQLDLKLLEFLQYFLNIFFTKYRISFGTIATTGTISADLGTKRKRCIESDEPSAKWQRNSDDRNNSTSDNHLINGMSVLKRKKKILISDKDGTDNTGWEVGLSSDIIWPLGSMPGQLSDDILLHRIEFDMPV